MSEKMSQSEFDERREAGQLALTLVGMSNVGKSYWTAKMADEAGFEVIGCDDLIEDQLGSVLQEAGFSGGIQDMAKWMGQPYDPQFENNQQTYLDLETSTVQSALDRLAEPLANGNLVIDTTGSVVHTDPAIREGLARMSVVVCLEATQNMQAEMFRLYIAEPKPVVWGDIYMQGADQSNHAALESCYPKLLSYRNELYRQMADVVIPRETSLSLGDASDFLVHVREQLAA